MAESAGCAIPSSTGDSTGVYVEQGVLTDYVPAGALSSTSYIPNSSNNPKQYYRSSSAMSNHSSSSQQQYQQQPRPMVVEEAMYGNPSYNSGNMNNSMYSNSNNMYSNTYSNSYNSNYYNSNNGVGNFGNTYSSSNNVGGITNSNSGLNFNDENSVDSALLAALRDSRERVALLRLEQVMIDFMNAPEGYLEVGGAYNSVVLSPNGNKRYAASQPEQLALQQQGGRQTSFQRCLLHRLADRFGILRETGTLLEGSIRLVKQKSSRVPNKLLLDHIEEGNEVAEGGGADGSSPEAAMQHPSIPNSGSNSSGGNNNTNNNKDGASGKPKRKMKIMKRNSSADSGPKSNKNSGTTKARKNKNFSDKEKAYAEARARIFAESQEGDMDGGSNTATQTAAQLAQTPTDAPPQTSNLSAASSSDAMDTSAFACSSIGGGPVDKSSSINSFSIPKRLSSSSLQGFNNRDNPGGMDTSINNQDDLPQAARSTNTTKATWRNRKEEENDPDFQRGAGLAQQQMQLPTTATAPSAAATPFGLMTTGSAAPYFYAPQPTAGYPPQQQYYPSDGYYGSNTNANNYGGRGGGRGYNNPTSRNYFQHPASAAQHQLQNVYRATGEAAAQSDVNCMKEFPSLR